MVWGLVWGSGVGVWCGGMVWGVWCGGLVWGYGVGVSVINRFSNVVTSLFGY